MVTAVYCDGGVALRNPSTIAGSWAFCAVNANGQRVHEAGGLLIPETNLPPWPMSPVEMASIAPLDELTNNQTELYAVLRALEWLPDRWSGLVCTDSQVTIGRVTSVRNCVRRNHSDYFLLRGWPVPETWQRLLHRHLRRLGNLDFLLLQGHPTRADLAAGIGAKRNLPVSLHQVWCDKECGRQTAAYLERLQKVK